ncbi:hypothetical protein GCM10009712_02670 [Pseudarthrobacter sulfonivorans]
MSFELRVRRSRNPSAAGDGASGTAPYRGKSPAPRTSTSHTSATPHGANSRGADWHGGPGNASLPGHNAASDAWTVGSAGVLLDFRAGSEKDSLGLLARAAAAALSERAGCSLDCAISVVRPGLTPLTAGTSEQAATLARWDLRNSDGPVSQAIAGRLAVILNDFSRDQRWPAYWGPLRDAGYRSVVSVPLQLESGCKAALTLITEKTGVFAPAVLADVVMFSKLAARSYVMASEVRAAEAAAAHLRNAMEARTSIDVACGVIMGQNRCSYEEAFGIIAKASSNRNVKVRALAESLLEDLPGGAPATHFKT